MTGKVERLKRRFNNAVSRTGQWRDLLDETYEFCIPERNTFNTSTPGERKNARVFDNTAVNGVISFTAKIQSMLTPPGQRWAQLTGGPLLSEEEKLLVTEQLEGVTKTIFSYIGRSNFDLAISESYFDLAIGTGVLLIHEGDDEKPFAFESVPLEQVIIEGGARGEVTAVWRRFDEFPNREIMRTWPDANINSNLQNKIDQNPDGTTNFIEGTININTKGKKPEHFEYIVMESGADELIVDRESESSDWVVFRWSKTPGEVYGRGVCISALPTIRSLNRMLEFELRGAQLAVNPPYMAFRSGAFNPWTASIGPNTVIPVDPIGGSSLWPIKPLTTEANLQFGQLLANDLRLQINSMMFAEPFGDNNTPVQTATEVSFRQQALAEKIGASFGRLEVELLGAIIKRCMFILKNKGLIPSIELDGKEVDVEFKSIIGQAQDQQDAKAFIEYYGNLAQIFGPQLAIAAINVTVLPPWLAEKFGVDLTLVKTSEELEQLSGQISQSLQQQPQLAQAGGGAGEEPFAQQLGQ